MKVHFCYQLKIQMCLLIFFGTMIVNVHFLFVLTGFIKTVLLVPICSTKLYTLRYNMFRFSPGIEQIWFVLEMCVTQKGKRKPFFSTYSTRQKTWHYAVWLSCLFFFLVTKVHLKKWFTHLYIFERKHSHHSFCCCCCLWHSVLFSSSFASIHVWACQFTRVPLLGFCYTLHFSTWLI